MGRNFVRVVLVTALLALIVCGSLAAWHFSAHAYYGPLVAVAGNQAPLAQQAEDVETSPPDQQQLPLSISLNLHNQRALSQLLRNISDPNSPQYQQFLTPDQFQRLFAPTDEEVERVVDYLRTQGITVTDVSPNNVLINASATVAEAQQAFHVEIHNFDKDGETFYANTDDPQVPSTLQPLVTGITGLDNSVKIEPLHHRTTKMSMDANAHLQAVGPQELEDAYNIGPLHDMGLNGDNQTIALFELDGYVQSDIDTYMQQYNLGNLNVRTTLVDGFNGVAGTGAVEVELDMQVVAAIAPHAQQLIYEGPNTNQGISDTYNRIVTDNKAQVLATSWGICESVMGSSQLKTLDNIFKQGVAQGMTIFAASGDAGAYDCKDTNLGVDAPASDPYVTGVGGTTLQFNGSGKYKGETAWSDPTDILRAPKGSGSGGGLSSTYAIPTWQTGPNVKNSYSNGKRQVPDVAAHADFGLGYAVYCTVRNSGCPDTGWVSVGGTSGASPVWAASTLLINQYLRSLNKARVGFFTPTLYTLANNDQAYPPFRDIVDGNNLFYPARQGYDLATGLGSPNVFNIARDLGGSTNPGSTTPTPVQTATPTPTPTPGVTPTPTPTPGVTPTPTPGVTPTPTPTPGVTPTPTPTPGVTPTPTVTTGTSTNGPILLAQDTFNRSDQTFWGTASDGNTWAGDANSINNFSISGNTGQVTNTSTSYSAVLGNQASDSEVLLTGSISSFNNANFGAVLRWSDGNNWYKGYLDGGNLIIQKKLNGNTTALATIPFVTLPATSYTLRFRMVGTTLSLKAWIAGQSEPTSWTATATDNSLQSGYCGMRILAPGRIVATITAFQANSFQASAS